jgi:putative transposase
VGAAAARVPVPAPDVPVHVRVVDDKERVDSSGRISNLHMADNLFKPGHHTPTHLFRTSATYMLTASIYGNKHILKADLRKAEWCDSFHKAAEIYQWKIIAWVVLSNHYHALLRSSADPGKSIDKFVASYHKFTATKWNKEDGQIGRPVWWNYFDTCIKDKREFFTKLNYIHWNPVKHGLVKRPEDYPYSSYHDFTKHKSAKANQRLEVGEVLDVPEF